MTSPSAFCPNCGTQQRFATARFCGKCGTAIPAVAPAAPASAPKKARGKRWPWALLALIVLLGIVTAVVWFTPLREMIRGPLSTESASMVGNQNASDTSKESASLSEITVTETTTPVSTPSPTATATPGRDCNGLDAFPVDEATPVSPSLRPKQSGVIVPGMRVELTGTGGLEKWSNECGTFHNESARSFALSLNGGPIGSVTCYVNRCDGEIIISESVEVGVHTIEVEGGGVMSIEILAAEDTPTATVPPSPTSTLVPTATPQPTDTPQPTATPVPTSTPVPTPACSLQPQGRFGNVWQRSLLGCPLDQAVSTDGATQRFQHGRMIWRKQFDRHYVLYDSGAWQSFADEHEEGMGEPNVHAPPAGLHVPVRGFGIVWHRHLGGPDSRLGWGTEAEYAVPLLVQDFEKGHLIEFSGQIYLLGQNGTNWSPQ